MARRYSSCDTSSDPGPFPCGPAEPRSSLDVPRAGDAPPWAPAVRVRGSDGSDGQGTERDASLFSGSAFSCSDSAYDSYYSSSESESGSDRVPRSQRRAGSATQLDTNNIDNRSVKSVMTPPPTLSMYDIAHQIGRGGFAVVHKATDRATGDVVALKQIGKRKLEKQDLLDCARNEAEIQLRCDHPNIVKVHDVFEDRDSIWLTLELCEEGNVSQLLRSQGHLPEQHAALYLRQLLRAIAYLHRNGVMHRDIKLSNLLLAKRIPSGMPSIRSATGILASTNIEHYVLKLSDFGLATHADKVEHHTMCGTHLCIAPEVAASVPYGPAADIYAFGIAAYTMMVGENPFGRQSGDFEKGVFPKVSPWQRMINASYEVPQNLSLVATDFLRQALRRNPDKRPTAVDLLQHDFFVALDEGRLAQGSELKVRPQLVPEAIAMSPSVAERGRKVLPVKEADRDAALNPYSISSTQNRGSNRGSTGDSMSAGTLAPSLSSSTRSSLSHPAHSVERTSRNSTFRSSAGASILSHSCSTYSSSSASASAASTPSSSSSPFRSRRVARAKFHSRSSGRRLSFSSVSTGTTAASILAQKTTSAPMAAPAVASSTLESVHSTSSFEQTPFVTRPLSTARIGPTSIEAPVGWKEQQSEPATAVWRRIEILPHTGELLLQDGGTHLRISADGLSVNVRRVDDENMAAAARWWAYSLRDLPIVHRDRYRYATQALDCIRANTPKVVVRDTRAGVVCKLMENDPLPLFEYLQEDGGCVRISLAHGRARIRMPVVVDEDQMAWPEGLVGAAGGMGRGQSSGQGTGQWFGIDLLGRLQLDTPEPVEVSVEREAVGVTVDIDDSWLPNPLPPPGWGQLLAQLSLAETETLLPRGTEDEVDEGADHSVDDERHQSNIPHSALYVFSIVQRAQVAMTYCLTLERNYEARCADQTTQLGHHPADPFPVHLERRIFVEEGEANDKVVEADGERKRRVAVADSTTRVWHKVSEMGAAAAVGGSFPEQSVGKESTALVEEPVALEAEPSETDGEMHIASENDGEVDADTGVGEGASVDLEKSDSPFWNPSARKLQGIGWTWRTPKGDLRINFEDGVQITIGADGGTLLYCDVLLGEPQTYEMSSGGLPPYAKEKLPDVMKAIALLKDVDGIS